MIPYNPKRWARLLMSFHGTVLPRVINRLALLALWTCLIVLVERQNPGTFHLDPLGHTLMGAVVGFLIVLRTNTAYERFWEGRKLWGAIVNTSRNLVREAAAFCPPARDLAELNVAYVLALKQFLRREHDFAELQPWMPPAVWEQVKASENPPLVVSYHLAAWVQRRLAEGPLNPILAQHLDERVRELLDCQGACERILKTPIPFNYAVHIKQFLTIYLLTLPFVLVAKMGWGSVAVVMVIAFGLGGIEEAGVEVEDPFGSDLNDLPLEGICSTIERDVTRLAELPEPPRPE